ncbi:hypothetical protein TFKS16_0579 [Tannerella forsythia KS16]|nr:hypothetical protein TF3313_0614 [Tannerella forsythia 3313]BAR50320.1 hypothetical protein TF3313_2915 [Tannerella forsythia 3313]BAR50883.1 hypothetical protein TFKS16_0579 [Tannerella forsythia KS16]
MDLFAYIIRHTKSFLCFVHHVKELFFSLFLFPPSSSFKRTPLS